MSIVEDGPRGRADLPAHLTRDGSKIERSSLLVHPDRGEAYCLECGSRVTIGKSGTEYGHTRYGRDGRSRCRYRPTSVDPDRDPTYAERGMQDRKAP